MEELLAQWFLEYNDLVFIAAGGLLVVGVVRDWDWLCDPIGKPHLPLSRGTLRFTFFLCGIVLMACGLTGLAAAE